MPDQKEQSLLKDLKDEEQLCIQKYARYEAEAAAPELKEVFAYIGRQEQQHLQTLNQMGAGQAPPSSGGGGQQGQTMPAPANYADDEDFQRDRYLCSDALATEKHVSSLYDTCIFEFKDQADRDALNHIQKEEQEHGKKIYDYMTANNMYS